MLLFALMLATAPLAEGETAILSAQQPAALINIAYNTAGLAVPASGELDLAALEDLRGGDGSSAVIITEQTLKAVNTGNSVTGTTIVSGDVSLGNGALP